MYNKALFRIYRRCRAISSSYSIKGPNTMSSHINKVKRNEETKSVLKKSQPYGPKLLKPPEIAQNQKNRKV